MRRPRRGAVRGGSGRRAIEGGGCNRSGEGGGAIALLLPLTLNLADGRHGAILRDVPLAVRRLLRRAPAEGAEAALGAAELRQQDEMPSQTPQHLRGRGALSGAEATAAMQGSATRDMPQ